MNQKRSVNISDGKNCVPVEKKSKHPTFLENATNYGMEYADYSSLHGVRYLGERKRNIWEKLWWLIVVVFSLYICITFILKSYSKFADSPIVISLDDTPTRLSYIPYPAFTICPNNRCRDTIYNYQEKLKLNASGGIPENELKEFYDAVLVCGNYKYTEDIPTVPNRLNYTIDSNIYKFIEKIAPTINQTIIGCSNQHDFFPCHSSFSTVLTDIGLCFSNNFLDKRNIFKSEVDITDYLMKSRIKDGWTLDDGFSENYIYSYPSRALLSGLIRLIVQLSANTLDQIEYSRTGFQLIVHNPAEVPSSNMATIDVGFNTGVAITIIPDVMVAEEALRQYDPKTRNCYFSSERPLRYYQNYTQGNCEIECLTNSTLDACGCVSIWMPHNDTTEICGLGKITCAKDVQGEIGHLEVYAYTDDALKFGTCNCMPSCSYVKYSVEVDNAREIQSDPIYTNLTFRVKGKEFMAFTRKVNYGWTEFIAECGGHLGLFIGFSFLSIFETVYFFSLRICCNARQYGRHYWSGSTDLLRQEVENNSNEMNTKPAVQPEDTSTEYGDIKLNKAVFNIDEP